MNPITRLRSVGRPTGIACIACVILTIVAFLLVTADATAQLRPWGSHGLRVGMTRAQVDSVIRADEWVRPMLESDPSAVTVDLLPDPSAPRAHPIIGCDRPNDPNVCTYIDRLILGFVVERGGVGRVGSLTVRTRSYGLKAKYLVEDVSRLNMILEAGFCLSDTCLPARLGNPARIGKFLAARKGSDTLVVKGWRWREDQMVISDEGSTTESNAITLRVIRDRAAGLAWSEIVYRDRR